MYGDDAFLFHTVNSIQYVLVTPPKLPPPSLLTRMCEPFIPPTVPTHRNVPDVVRRAEVVDGIRYNLVKDGLRCDPFREARRNVLDHLVVAHDVEETVAGDEDESVPSPQLRLRDVWLGLERRGV